MIHDPVQIGPEPGGHPRRAAFARWAGFVLGLALLVGAVVMVVRSDPGARSGLIDRLVAAPPWMALAIVLGPICNWLLVSACLWMLMRRHGRVGLGEMTTLVGSAWLLNHLPMRPGLIGRVGYHRAINGIRIRDSVEATLWSLGLAGVAGVMGLTLAYLMPHGLGGVRAAAALAMPVPVLGAFALGIRAAGRVNSAWLMGALMLRYADMALWAGRYAVVFALMGLRIDPVAIIVVTGVSQVAQLVPIAGGGLGLREWLVAATAGALGTLDGAFDAALAGDLINRAVETLAVVPVGIVCGILVARRVRAGRRDAPGVGA